MQLLLDTHALLWWLAGDASLSPRARAAVEDTTNAVFVSTASAWKISTKYRIGKLPGVAAIVADLEGVVVAQGFKPLPIASKHGQIAGNLPGPHRDPFDRMLVAQAMLESLTLVSIEAIFDGFGVIRLW